MGWALGLSRRQVQESRKVVRLRTGSIRVCRASDALLPFRKIALDIRDSNHLSRTVQLNTDFTSRRPFLLRFAIAFGMSISYTFTKPLPQNSKI